MLAAKLHMSGPIAVAIAGLLIGNRGPHDALSDETQRGVKRTVTVIRFGQLMNDVEFDLRDTLSDDS